MGTEKCPFCGQEIDTAATKCFFCGAALDEESVHKRLEQLHQRDAQLAWKIPKPFAAAALIIIILITIVFFPNTAGKKSTPVVDPVVDRAYQRPIVRLKAKVTFTGESFIVSNNDSFDWSNVEFEMMPESTEERFSLRIPIILAKEEYTVAASEFSRDDGTSFNPYKMKPKKFWILCETPAKENGAYQAAWK